MIKFLGTYLEPLSYLIYLGTFLLHYPKVRSPKMLVLVFYYLTATILSIYANWLLTQPQDDPLNYNDLAYNAIFLLTVPYLSFYFLHTLTTPAGRAVVRVLLVVVLLIFAWEVLSGRAAVFNSLIAALSYAFVVLCSFVYYYEILTYIKEHNILLDFDFWIISAFILHFLGNFFIVLAWNYLSLIYEAPLTAEQKFQFTALWSVHNVLLFLSSAITLTASVWINYRKESPSPL